MGQGIEERVYTIVRDILDSSIEINGDTKFSELGINSLNYIKIVVSLEDEFEIEFADQDLDYSKYTCVADIVAYIKTILKG